MEKSMNFLLVAVFCVIAIHCIEGHLYFGSCPELLTAENFKVSDIEGTWYEIEALGSFIERRFTKCNSPKFITKSEDKVNVEYSRVSWPAGRIVSKGFGKVLKDGQLELFFSLPGVGMQSFQYHILAIEKDSYAVAWSCTQLPLMHMQKAWILSRNTSLDNATLDKVHDIVEFNGLNRNSFVKVKQTNCQTGTNEDEENLIEDEDLGSAIENVMER
ncbi:apolipoprotein D [Nilaparvata lugens]|uniref:apolipoprotein D n=1 Tax=Nilaparvata lugens TaxID=108931 RepID=UPI00193D31EC|nr:apolipoprotein D [Nilaparvata lugens]WJZ69070.1 apolipoprotein D-like protein 8 [Nilaparvata lugens]